MILPKKVVFIAGIILAVIEAVQQYLHLKGYWHAGISAIVLFCAVLGIRAATPAQIAAKVPQHIGVIVGSALTALDVFQQAVPSMPRGVHMAIGVILAVGATLFVHVTGFATSKGALKELAAAHGSDVASGGAPATGATPKTA